MTGAFAREENCTISWINSKRKIAALASAIWNFALVPEEGLEPSHTRVRQILSLLRLPFRHSGGIRLPIRKMERAKGIEPS